MSDIFVHVVEPDTPLPEDEFWRDVEATNRCNDPKKAKQFLSSLIVRRAHWEATQIRLTTVEVEGFVKARSYELWHRCRAMGFPQLTIFNIAMNFEIKFPETP